MENQDIITKRVLDFSDRPGPRYREQGKDSGEEFYINWLKNWFDEAIRNGKHLKVILDGPDGYLSSFLDEAFGRLVYDYGKEKVDSTLIVISKQEPVWIDKLNKKTFPSWNERKLKGWSPRVTQSIAY